MKAKIKRIIGIIKSAGLKKTSELIIIKIERTVVAILSPIFIKLARLGIYPCKKSSVNVLVLLEQRYSVSALNRAYDLSEYLTLAGYNVKIASPASSLFRLLNIKKYSVIVFQRSIKAKIIDAFLELSVKNKIKTVYDCDDLTYDTELANNLKEDVESSTARLLRVALEHYNVYAKCSYFLTTTNFLAAHSKAKAPEKKVFILRNGLNKKYINICDSINVNNSASETKIIIGYMSGTATHNSDFKLVEKPILEIMKKYPHVYLKIVGLLSIPECFFDEGMSDRIIKKTFMNFYNLPYNINDFSINIAPSIIGNPFTEGKSELKYVYAGYLGIPTAASSTDAFRTAISNSVNGFLCSNEQEWFDSLEQLVTDTALRNRIGEEAKKHIKQEYTPEKMRYKADSVFRQIIMGADDL